MPKNVDQLPMLKNTNSQVREAYEEHSIIQKYKAGEILSFEGQECAYFFVVLSGDIRVYKLGENGREVSLYHIRSNQSCILTAFSILTQTDFPAYAVAEEDVEMVLIPAPIFREWVDHFAIWKEHLFNTLSLRVTEILDTLDRVAFQRVDARIAQFLVNTVNGNGNMIEMTHENMARELGTSRVVVSRILENFERRDWISLSRAKVTVLNKKALLYLSKNNGTR